MRSSSDSSERRQQSEELPPLRLHPSSHGSSSEITSPFAAVKVPKLKKLIEHKIKKSPPRERKGKGGGSPDLNRLGLDMLINEMIFQNEVRYSPKSLEPHGDTSYINNFEAQKCAQHWRKYQDHQAPKDEAKERERRCFESLLKLPIIGDCHKAIQRAPADQRPRLRAVIEKSKRSSSPSKSATSSGNAATKKPQQSQKLPPLAPKKEEPSQPRKERSKEEPVHPQRGRGKLIPGRPLGEYLQNRVVKRPAEAQPESGKVITIQRWWRRHRELRNKKVDAALAESRRATAKFRKKQLTRSAVAQESEYAVCLIQRNVRRLLLLLRIERRSEVAVDNASVAVERNTAASIVQRSWLKWHLLKYRREWTPDSAQEDAVLKEYAASIISTFLVNANKRRRMTLCRRYVRNLLNDVVPVGR